MELKEEIVMMSPPASDSGSPPQFSPYSVDSEPGSPLLDHEQVTVFKDVADLMDYLIFILLHLEFILNI